MVVYMYYYLVIIFYKLLIIKYLFNFIQTKNIRIQLLNTLTELQWLKLIYLVNIFGILTLFSIAIPYLACLMRSVIYFLFFAVLLSSCVGKLKEPELIDVDNIKLGGAGKLNSLSGDVRLFNPNKQNLSFKSGNLDIYVEDRLLGKTVLDSLIKVPKLDTFLIPVKIDLQTNNLFSNALSFAFKDSLKVRFEGKVKVGRSGMYITRPVRYETKEKIDILKGMW